MATLIIDYGNFFNLFAICIFRTVGFVNCGLIGFIEGVFEKFDKILGIAFGVELICRDIK
jgi:hypothetical protein